MRGTQRWPLTVATVGHLRWNATVATKRWPPTVATVQRFVAEEIRFTDIPKIIEHTLNNIQTPNTHTLASLLKIDQDTRDFAQQLDPKKL